VIPTLAIKLEHFEEEDIMQKKAKWNGIPKLMQEHTYKYSKYIYYR
jgi:hypothetical protein